MAHHQTSEPGAAGDGPSGGGLPRWAKVIVLLVVIALAIVVLFTTVFPWVEERMQDPTMGTLLAPVVTAPRAFT